MTFNLSFSSLSLKECEKKEDEKKEVFAIEPAPISLLPNEIIVHLFSFLSVKDQRVLSLVCRSWKELSIEKSLWPLEPLLFPGRKEGKEAYRRDLYVKKGLLKPIVANPSNLSKMSQEISLSFRPQYIVADKTLAVAADSRHCSLLDLTTNLAYDLTPFLNLEPSSLIGNLWMHANQLIVLVYHSDSRSFEKSLKILNLDDYSLKLIHSPTALLVFPCIERGCLIYGYQLNKKGKRRFQVFSYPLERVVQQVDQKGRGELLLSADMEFDFKAMIGRENDYLFVKACNAEGDEVILAIGLKRLTIDPIFSAATKNSRRYRPEDAFFSSTFKLGSQLSIDVAHDKMRYLIDLQKFAQLKKEGKKLPCIAQKLHPQWKNRVKEMPPTAAKSSLQSIERAVIEKASNPWSGNLWLLWDHQLQKAQEIKRFLPLQLKDFCIADHKMIGIAKNVHIIDLSPAI